MSRHGKELGNTATIIESNSDLLSRVSGYEQQSNWYKLPYEKRVVFFCCHQHHYGSSCAGQEVVAISEADN
jgi:hypothetical protein